VSSTDAVKKETRKKIYDTYDEVIVRLCPHPGHLVTEGKFSGKLSDVREDFKIHVDHIISDMLNNLHPKRISSNQILLCRELPDYVKEYVTLYENVKTSLPEAMTILETTEKICQENAKTKTIHYYKENMMSRIKARRMTKDDIIAWHNSCLRDAKKYFKKMYVMGKDDDIKKIGEDIMKSIDKEYQQFLCMSKEGGVLVLVTEFVKDVLKTFNINFGILNEIFFKNLFLVLGLGYILTTFMPFGGEIVAFMIRYTICFMGGMYLCIYLKDHESQKEIITDDKTIN